jgi:hypothetical protein
MMGQPVRPSHREAFAATLTEQASSPGGGKTGWGWRKILPEPLAPPPFVEFPTEALPPLQPSVTRKAISPRRSTAARDGAPRSLLSIPMTPIEAQSGLNAVAV